MSSPLIQIDLAPRRPIRKPEWLKARAPVGEKPDFKASRIVWSQIQYSAAQNLHSHYTHLVFEPNAVPSVSMIAAWNEARFTRS